jgi:hypothetical protein
MTYLQNLDEGVFGFRVVRHSDDRIRPGVEGDAVRHSHAEFL